MILRDLILFIVGQRRVYTVSQTRKVIKEQHLLYFINIKQLIYDLIYSNTAIDTNSIHTSTITEMKGNFLCSVFKKSQNQVNSGSEVEI